MQNSKVLKNRVDFLYYEENMTQKEVGEILGISRQRVWAILNSNEDHKERKLKRTKYKVIDRKVQFNNNTSPTIAIPKNMLEKIGINSENRIVEIKVEGQKIIIKKKFRNNNIFLI